MEWMDAEIAAPRRPLMLTVDQKSTEDSASDHNQYIDLLLAVASFAYQRESATKPSTFIDSIARNASFLGIFALFLLVNYGSHISRYQVLVCVCLTPLFLFIYIKYVPFLFLEEDIKWIRRESRLLNALSEDAAKVMDLKDHVETKAHEIVNTVLYSGGVIIEGLGETEEAWLAKTKIVVRKANGLVETFEKMRKDSHGISFAMMSVKNFMQIERLFIETKRVKEDINESISLQKVHRINMCEFLERSRSNTRSLLDRPIYEHDQGKWVHFKGRVASAAALTSSIVDKINGMIPQNPVLMCNSSREQSVRLKLLLLHPFLEDIQGLRFESQIEEAWVNEVEEFIQEAHNFLQRPAICSWNARRKLKEDIRCIDAGLTELLKRKEIYGFKFIARDSSKYVCRSPYHSTRDDRIISSVVDKMRGYLNEDSDVLGEVFYEVTSLCTQLESMHKLVDESRMFESRYNSRMAWLEQMRIIVQTAEKCVQNFIDNSGIIRTSNNLFKTRAGITLSREIDEIQHTISVLVRSIKAYEIEFREESSAVVGLEEDIQALVSRLTTNGEHHSVISILGIGGIGKTTLANKIFYHGAVARHFPRRVWISLPWTSNESWTQQVYDIVDEERYLLVLDNISTREELCTARKAGFPVASYGSRILFTTRHRDLATMSNSPPHQLRLRTKEETWKLFIQMVHIPAKEETQAKEILSKCGGFPLAIIRIGYLMSGKDMPSAQELKRVIGQNEKPLLETYTLDSIQRLRLHHLFKCHTYLQLFPADFEIPARRLMALWIAEDLVQAHNKETHEDVAKKYLSELIDWGMIQVVKRKLNGEVKTCRLPYALQDFRLEATILDQRVTLHFKRNDPPSFHGEGSSNFPVHVLSVLSFDTREGNKPGEEIGNSLRSGIAGGCFRRLQVLDLERVFRPELPNNIGKLSKLKYLGLRWTYLESLPASIGDLLNLQTLDVKHTYVHTLPSSIWKLQKLQYLYLNQSYRSKFVYQQGRNSLKNLQTLWGVFVDKDSPLKDGLDKLTGLRKLGLAFQLDPPKQEVIVEWIEKLKHLKSLRMRSIGETGEPREIVCMPLSGLQHLSNLNLFGKLDPAMVDKFPKNLTDLTLSASLLSNDPMLELEKLSNLRLLCLYSNSYRGNKMLCSAGGFPQLVVLKLWNLEELVVWDVEEKAMQSLRELEIRSCTNLKVPNGLRYLKTLTELKLTNMPEKFAATIAKTKWQIWDDITHSPAITTVNWETMRSK